VVEARPVRVPRQSAGGLFDSDDSDDDGLFSKSKQVPQRQSRVSDVCFK